MSYIGTLSNSEITQFTEMGFTTETIQKAYEKSIKERRSVINILLESSDCLNANPKDFKQKFEPLNPEQRIRVKGVPVGLKNVGNTCYFNSLIQSYFFNPRFVKEIFSFDFELELPPSPYTTEKPAKIKRLEASIKLIKEFQKLFALMTLSDQKYIDPSDVLNTIVDEYGNPIQIGDEKDVTELNFHILARIDEALTLQAKIKNKNSLLDDDRNENGMKDSKIIEIEEEDYNIMSSVRLLKKYTRYFEVNTSKTFFGKLKETISYQENGKIVAHSDEVVLGPIILDISAKDLYSSWEAFSHSMIDDFKLSNGLVTKVNKSYWIINPPETLCFQLQRVGFNKAKGEIEKLNDVFKFDKEIFIDRFLIDNEKTYYANLNIIKNLQKKLDKIQKSIDKLNNYEKSNLSIQSILDHSRNIINSKLNLDIKKGDDSFDLLDISDLNFSSENGKDTSDPVPEKEIEITAKVLLHYADETKKKLDKLNKDLLQHKNQYDSIYSNMKTSKYKLMGILMHEGKAQSGHYYSYLHNFEKNLWQKFNDIHVTEEPNEAKIFDEAYGLENKSAYFLIYISEKSLNSTLTTPAEFSDILGLNSPNNLLSMMPTTTSNEKKIYYDYMKMIPTTLKKEVMKDNFQFEKSLKDFQFQNISTQIVENYQERFSYINEFVRKHKEKVKANNNNYLPPLINFGAYVRDDSDMQDNNFKWHILDCALREASQSRITIHELEKEKNISDKLKEHFATMGSFKIPSKLFLTKQESSKLDMKFAEYINKVQNREVLIFVMEKLLEDKYNEALMASCTIIDANAPNSPSYFARFVKEIMKIILLKLSIDSILLYNEQNKPKFYENLRMVTTFGKFIPKTDLIMSQIINVFSEMVSNASRGNEGWNEYIFMHIKHMRNYTIPKEYETILSKPNEKIDEIQNTVIEKYLYLWKIKEKDDSVEKVYDNCLKRVSERFNKILEFMGKYYEPPKKPLTNEELQ